MVLFFCFLFSLSFPSPSSSLCQQGFGNLLCLFVCLFVCCTCCSFSLLCLVITTLYLYYKKDNSSSKTNFRCCLRLVVCLPVVTPFAFALFLHELTFFLFFFSLFLTTFSCRLQTRSSALKKLLRFFRFFLL